MSRPIVKAKESVTWQQLDNDVRGIAYHSYGGVGILSSSHLRVYKRNNGEMFHSSDEQGDRVATFQERYHAILDRRLEGVKLYCHWSIFIGTVSYIIPTHEEQGMVFLAQRTIWYSAHRKIPKAQKYTAIQSHKIVSNASGSDNLDHIHQCP